MPHCKDDCILANRKPQKYTIKYVPSDGGMEFVATVEKLDSLILPPDSEITLNEGVEANTKYNISVITKIFVTKYGVTVNSDASQIHFGLTGRFKLIFFIYIFS